MTNICKALKEDFAQLFFKEGAAHAMKELLRSGNSLDDEWEALIESIEKENEEKRKQSSERPKTIVQIDDLDEPEKSSIAQIDDVTTTAALTTVCSAAYAASCC